MHNLIWHARVGLALAVCLAAPTVGCKAKLDRSGPDGSTHAVGTDLQQKNRTRGPRVSTPAPRDWSVGVPECDRLVRFIRCYISKIPKKSAGPILVTKAYWKIVQGYQKMARNPASRVKLVNTCKKHLDAMHKQLRHLPSMKSCMQGK